MMPLRRDNARPRVGLFGLLGLGNSGNEASVEAMLGYLRSAHPDAVIDAMTGGAERVQASFGIEATPMTWYEMHQEQASGRTGLLLRMAGKVVDPLRIISWVRGHDVIIVPGMGVLEATTPLRAYGFPLAMCVLSLAGRLCRVNVALVSVGASRIRQPAVRALLNISASMATYRSYRDAYSIGVMRERGVNTANDRIFPDLAFSFPVPAYTPGDPRLVGVGVMDYHGGNDDRARAAELHAGYLEMMIRFVNGLLDDGFEVRLFGGDDSCDYTVAQEVLTAVRWRAQEAGGAAKITVANPSSYADMLAMLNDVGTVIATRYHNVLGALLLGKPTLAIGYAQKFNSLMENMGVSEFGQQAHDFDVTRLMRQFNEAQDRRTELVTEIMKRKAANLESVEQQFALLTATLFRCKYSEVP